MSVANRHNRLLGDTTVHHVIEDLRVDGPAPARVPSRLARRLDASRVFIVGACGAGKTTLAHRLEASASPGGLVVQLRPEHAVPATADAVLDEAVASGPGVLVLDDAHHLIGSDAEPVLERIVADIVTVPRLVVASRVPPSAAVAHAAPDAEVITTRDLALRIDEIAEVFHHVCGCPLSLEQASKVASETAGWAALVRLLAVRAGRFHTDADELGAAVDAALECGFAAGFLEEHLDALPASVAVSLERASIFTTFELAPCASLLGSDAATALITALDTGVVAHTVELGRRRVLPPVLRRHLRSRCGADETVTDAPPAAPPTNADTPPAGSLAAVWSASATSGLPRRHDADPLADAVRRLRAGDVVGAVPLLQRSARSADPERRTAIRLALLIIRAPLSTRDLTLDALAALERDALALGLPRLARLTRGAIAAASARPDRAVRSVVEECEVRGDESGAAIVVGIDHLMRLRSGRATTAQAAALADRASRLGAADVAAWAEASAALIAAIAGSPQARELFVSAESASIATGLGAAGALLDAAQALTDAPGRSRDRLASSRRLALAAGMPRLPIDVPRVSTSAPSRPVTAAPRATTRRPHVTVGCFGGFRLQVDGAEVDLRAVRPQARALLRMLALNAGSPLHREIIAEVLWGDLGIESAVHALHVSVSSLRRVLPAQEPAVASSIVERDGEAYRLGLLDRRDCDLADFDESLADAAIAKARRDTAATASGLRHALDLYLGDVLPEDGPAEWAIGARERYRIRAAEAATSLAHLELHLGSPRAAVAAASRAVEIDPWLDESWRTLVTVHEQSGDVVAARRASDSYRRMRVALGVE